MTHISLYHLVENTDLHLCFRYLQEFLERVIKGFEDPHSGVRNGAMFALGQFSEHLQPGITKYSNELIPLIVNYAVKVSGEHLYFVNYYKGPLTG